MNTGIALRLPAGDQVDLELAVMELVNNLRLHNTDRDGVKDFYGECRVLQGSILHGVQFSVTIDGIADGECQIDCSWHIDENYSEKAVDN